MKTKKRVDEPRTNPQDDAGRFRSVGTINRKAMQPAFQVNARAMDEATVRSVTKHIEQQTLQAFFDAVNTWRLNEADSARLVGVEPATVAVWKAGKAPDNEEVLARMTMVALIRTALDISLSSSLSTEWMTLPNSGYPYLGLSPVSYVGEHGWPGLFWVLRQCQARAVGN